MILVLLLAAGCQQKPQHALYKLKELRVGLLPDQNEVSMRTKYSPLLDYIATYTGLKTTLILPTSYEGLLDLFSKKKIDLALFGGATYVKAHRLYGAKTLVMRDIDKQYRSIFFVKANSGIKSFADLKGKAIAFGSRLSTGGYYMPRYFLGKKNIDIVDYFNVIKYSGAHDKTAEWVRDGVVDVGVAHSGVINDMYRDGRLKETSLKIIWETPVFPDYVWAAQQQLLESDVTLLRNAFMLLNPRKPAQKRILDNLGGGFYLDAHHKTFNILNDVVYNLGY
ncbi:hypothetical protein MNBD_GAMMA22-1112 [hydrothermal vent metagenome]|uniref:Phosphonate ABC transporter phosphate-binding periplasmic component (TC 3.A.1.9.1) n=1 Tax=hydrothermal vent metagenome TaxID=652676 RepID=A0A3B1AJL3_9ZZZZ